MEARPARSTPRRPTSASRGWPDMPDRPQCRQRHPETRVQARPSRTESPWPGRRSFAPAGEAELFRCGGLRRPLRRQSGELRNPVAHGVADTGRSSAVHRSVSGRDEEFGAMPCSVLWRRQEPSTVGILPLRVGWRKMRSDVTVGQRTEDGVAQRVKPDITIGMRGEARSCGFRHRRGAPARRRHRNRGRRNRCPS